MRLVVAKGWGGVVYCRRFVFFLRPTKHTQLIYNFISDREKNVPEKEDREKIYVIRSHVFLIQSTMMMVLTTPKYRVMMIERLLLFIGLPIILSASTTHGIMIGVAKNTHGDVLARLYQNLGTFKVEIQIRGRGGGSWAMECKRGR